MTTLETLMKARAAIAMPETWTRHIRKLSRPDGSYAHCALGALDRALGRPCDDSDTFSPAIPVLALCLTPEQIEETKKYDHHTFGKAAWVRLPTNGLIAQFNNSHTHAEVLAVFDRAIERQRAIDAMSSAAPSKEETPSFESVD